MGTTTARPYLRLRADDTVGRGDGGLAAGTELVVGDRVVRLRDDVPAGHKVALADVPTGGQVRKYGQVIGVATRPIQAGEHVHTHNLAFADFGRDYAFGADLEGAVPAPIEPRRHLQGHRPGRRSGGDQELHRDPDLGQLLGHCGPHGGRPVRRRFRPPGRVPQPGRRRRPDPWFGVRDGGRGTRASSY